MNPAHRQDTDTTLDKILPNAPAARCHRFEAGQRIVCRATGQSKNALTLICDSSAVRLNTDGENGAPRFPPDTSQPVCDWTVLTRTEESPCRGYYVELKGSDEVRAVIQLVSTATYMHDRWHIDAINGYVVLRNRKKYTKGKLAQTGRPAALVKFRKRFKNPPVFCDENKEYPIS